MMYFSFICLWFLFFGTGPGYRNLYNDNIFNVRFDGKDTKIFKMAIMACIKCVTACCSSCCEKMGAGK